MRAMILRRITSADLVEVTGFSRHRLRGFLKELPGYSDRVGTERVAREYSRQDLAVIAVCCELEECYGLRREAIAQLVPDLRKELGVPRAVAKDAFLILTTNPPCVRYIDGILDVRVGTVLSLNAILNRIDIYLLGEQVAEADSQRSLDLGPVPIVATRPSQASNNNQKRVVSKNAAS